MVHNKLLNTLDFCALFLSYGLTGQRD